MVEVTHKKIKKAILLFSKINLGLNKEKNQTYSTNSAMTTIGL